MTGHCLARYAVIPHCRPVKPDLRKLRFDRPAYALVAVQPVVDVRADDFPIGQQKQASLKVAVVNEGRKPIRVQGVRAYFRSAGLLVRGSSSSTGGPMQPRRLLIVTEDGIARAGHIVIISDFIDSTVSAEVRALNLS